MIAWVEKPDKSYEEREMGAPVCGEDFCDTCGDCLSCYAQDCDGSEWCGRAFWVIYLHNKKNPYSEQANSKES